MFLKRLDFFDEKEWERDHFPTSDIDGKILVSITEVKIIFMKKEKQLENLKQQIRKEINKQYCTIEEFCFLNDIDKSSIYRFFKGKRNIGVNILLKGLGQNNLNNSVKKA